MYKQLYAKYQIWNLIVFLATQLNANQILDYTNWDVWGSSQSNQVGLESQFVMSPSFMKGLSNVYVWALLLHKRRYYKVKNISPWCKSNYVL